MQEVSRVRSTKRNDLRRNPRLKDPFGKEQIHCKKLNPWYERYGWYPHVKYKIGSTKEMEEILFPFLDRYPLQAKKAKDYALFKQVVLMYRKKKHLTDDGFRRIIALRDRIRETGKKHYDGNR